MSVNPQIMDTIQQTGQITDEDVLAFRKAFWLDGVISAHEADEVFKANDLCPIPPQSWVDFFVEGVSSYIVQNVQPVGYVSQANAQWLINRISADGQVHSNTEMRLLIKVMEQAINVPDELVIFTMQQVRLSILEGSGPLGDRKTSQKGSIDEHEVQMLREILYSMSGEGSSGISRIEAEFLFKLNEEVQLQNNHPSWNELFVKVVLNYLMAAKGYQPQSAQKASDQQAWLETPNEGLGAFLGKMATTMPAFSHLFSQDKHHLSEMNDRLEDNIVASQKITQEEANWLAEKIQADGVIDASEKEILRFIMEENGEVPEVLHPFIKTAV